MPTLGTSMSSIASSVLAAEEKNIDTRGSRGLYSMANFMSGWAWAKARSPVTAYDQIWPWSTWKG